MREDRWAEWFLHPGLESGGEAYAAVLRALEPIRDRVIEGAAIAEGHVAVDIGSGSGLIAFAAAGRVGAAGRALFVDISPAMLAHCRSAAEARGIAARCEFIEASVLDLGAIPDGVADAVTIRSVLIYVADRARAFAELHRILKPGGRLSLYEPVIGAAYAGDAASAGITQRSIESMLAPLVEGAESDGSIFHIDHQELLSCAEGAGFSAINLSLEIDVARGCYFTASPEGGAPIAQSTTHRTAGIFMRGRK